MESSPAYTTSIESWMVEIFEIVDRLSPANYLVTCKRHILHIFRCFSRFNLLGPAAFSLALLNIAMLHQSTVVVLVEYLVPEYSSSCLELSIFHNLIVNVFWILFIDIFLLNTLFTLVYVDIAISLINMIIHL